MRQNTILSFRYSSSSSPTGPSSSSPQSSSSTLAAVDPQALASEFIQKSSNSRIPGTEAIESYLTPQQRRNNYIMAIGLLGFVGWVFSYSFHAVGGSRTTDKNELDGMNVEQILRAEAHDAQIRKLQQEKKEKQVQELVALDEELAKVERDGTKQGIFKKIESLEMSNITYTSETESENLQSTENKKPRTWKRYLMFWKRD